MKNLPKLLSALLLGSAISLSIGGVLLYSYGLVQPLLIELTALAVAIILSLSYFVFKRSLTAINISTVLGVIAPLFSISVPAHIDVLLSLGTNGLLSVLALLQFFGFDLFPIVFVIFRVVFRGDIARPK